MAFDGGWSMTASSTCAVPTPTRGLPEHRPSTWPSREIHGQARGYSYLGEVPRTPNHAISSKRRTHKATRSQGPIAYYLQATTRPQSLFGGSDLSRLLEERGLRNPVNSDLINTTGMRPDLRPCRESEVIIRDSELDDQCPSGQRCCSSIQGTCIACVPVRGRAYEIISP